MRAAHGVRQGGFAALRHNPLLVDLKQRMLPAPMLLPRSLSTRKARPSRSAANLLDFPAARVQFGASFRGLLEGLGTDPAEALYSHPGRGFCWSV
jgi:hypothetical protein